MKPYQVKCKCKHIFLVSHSVVHRCLYCPVCGRYTYYERNLKGNQRYTEVCGRFKSKKELERRLYVRAKKDPIFDRPSSKKNKESSSLRGVKDSNTDKADRPKDAIRPVQRANKGLHNATGSSHKVSRKVEKSGLAK